VMKHFFSIVRNTMVSALHLSASLQPNLKRRQHRSPPHLKRR
jgi:hypothetical protein